MTAEDKRAYRREMLSRRRSLPADKLISGSRLIAQTVISSDEYKKSDTLLCFIPTEIEVDTRPIIDRAFADGKKVAAPRCIKDRPEMRFYYIGGYGDLEKGAYGISEPRESCPECTEFVNSLCITPALCCARNGHRMGYGRGYYDRFLESYGGISCAVIFEDFLFDDIPCEPTDVPVKLIATERTLCRCLPTEV